MNYSRINKCIKNAVKRITPRRCQMGTYSYINYYCRRYELTIEENLYIRKTIKKYVKRNQNKIFEIDFTINGKAC